MSETHNQQKKCIRCELLFDISFFNKNKRKKDGRESYCKSCTSFFSKQAYLKAKGTEHYQNRIKEYAKSEKRKNYITKWRQENKEKCCSYSAKYRSKKENREKLKAKRNKKRENELAVKRYHANKEYYKEKAKKKRFSNIEKTRIRERTHAHKRRVEIRSSEKHHTKDDVLLIKEKQNNKCIYCLKSIKEKFHIDHIIPLSKGGHNGSDNIQILCPSCNLRKNAKDPFEFANSIGRLL